MMPTDDLQATARSAIPQGYDREGWNLDVPLAWIASVPAILVAVAALAWGTSLLATGRAFGFLPSLPAPLSGIDLVALGVVLALTPIGTIFLLADRRRRRLDEQFPDLLSDLAANRRAGFTLAEAVDLAAHGDYGPLTSEVRRMAAQLSWNVPFEEALRRFAQRVDTPLVTRSITLVLEAERSGGHITDVLSAVARDAREIRHLERERHLAMRTYTLVMYVIFLVFLAVVAVLQAQMLPQLVQAAGAAGNEVFGAAGGTSLAEHRTFFYTSALVQALGSGTMAGMMGRGRVGPGLIHAAVMAAIAVITFSIVLV